MTPLPARLRAVPSLVVAAVLGAALATPAPALAAFGSPGDFNRAQVALRANAWVKDRVPYDQGSYYRGYRQDCSGFVSMAWGLGTSHVTWTLLDVAWPIHKSDLTLGDIMLDTTGNANQQHVVIFDKWANTDHTAYWEWELAGSTDRPVHRVVPYPFWTGDRDQYKPYRFAVAPQYTGKKPKPAAPVKAQAPPAAPAAPATPALAPATATPAPAPAAPATAAPPAAKPHAAPAAVTPVKAIPPKPGVGAPASAPISAALPRPVASPARAGRPDPDAGRSERPLSEPVGLWLLRAVVAWLAA